MHADPKGAFDEQVDYLRCGYDAGFNWSDMHIVERAFRP